MANQALFPYIRCEGTPYEIGRAHGEQGREKIRTSIECYRSMFFDYSGIDWDTAQRYAHTFIPSIEGYDPDIMAELRGIADGSGFGLDEILALNVRSEIVLQGSQVKAMLDGGCSSPVAAHAVTDGKTLTLTGLYVSPDETIIRKGALTGPAAEAETLGKTLAERLRKGGN